MNVGAIAPDTSEALQQALAGRLPAQQGCARDKAQAVKAAKEFEAIFVTKLLDEMRQTIPQSGLGESEGADQVQGIFWFELAQELGNKGALGLWKQVYRQMMPQAATPPAGANATEPSP